MKIGVAGTGHLGKIHLKCIGLIPEYDLAGFYDPNPDIAAEVSREFGVKAYPSLEEMLADVDVLDIVSPTTTHFELAKLGLEAGCHVFIEKPVTSDSEECRKLLELSEKRPDQKIQIGHVERFNPAFLALEDIGLKPGFIEGHRLANFNPRGTDVSVVLDLMIHDLDLILKMVGSPVKQVHAKGVAILSKSHDICNARIEFENGTVVNLTASRMSLKAMRKLRVFQEGAYIALDFLEKEAQIIRFLEEGEKVPADREIMELPTPEGTRRILVDFAEKKEVNAIKMELESFYECISSDSQPYVSLEDGFKALDLAEKIMAASGEKKT
ncbi:MAG: gfo/Idh/MocA family oxidoreductase [Saprospirales bacterium]|nr:MAG: gfo/Idh/MocA family oxidoreductase [Saprospirales bacterium]